MASGSWSRPAAATCSTLAASTSPRSSPTTDVTVESTCCSRRSVWRPTSAPRPCPSGAASRRAGRAVRSAGRGSRRRLEVLLPVAEAHGVDLALEPEPGMFVERISDVAVLRRSSRVGPTGCASRSTWGTCAAPRTPTPPPACSARATSSPTCRSTTCGAACTSTCPSARARSTSRRCSPPSSTIDFAGLVAVELPRHSHAAPTARGVEPRLPARRRASSAGWTVCTDDRRRWPDEPHDDHDDRRRARAGRERPRHDRAPLPGGGAHRGPRGPRRGRRAARRCSSRSPATRHTSSRS